MVVKKLSNSSFLAEFWLFGHMIQTEFDCRDKAIGFIERIKSSFTVELFPISYAVEKYLIDVSSLKSDESRKFDYYILHSFTNYLEDHYVIGTDEPLNSISLLHLESYQKFLLVKKRMKPSSINRHFNTIKNFFNKCHKWEFLLKNPAHHLSMLTEHQSKKEVWTDKEIVYVMDLLSEKDKLLFLFLKLTGARLSSAARLKVSDVNLEKSFIYLSSQKGSDAKMKYYKFPCHDKLKKFLTPILNNKNPSDYIFLNEHNKPYICGNFSKKISRLLSRPEVKAMTNNKKLFLHGLRHSVATQLHQNGLTIKEVKELLGHCSVTVTEGYVHTDEQIMLNKLNNIA